MEHFLGGEKNIFLIRDIDDATIMAAAPVESCQSAVPRSHRSHLGSVVYVRNRLHRTRRRFEHILANSLNHAAH